MTAESFKSIGDPERLLLDYIVPTNSFAWPLYDEDAAPDVVVGADLTAPALMSYSIPRQLLNQMGRAGTSYAQLVDALRAFVETPAAGGFSDLSQAEVLSLTERKRGEDVEGPADWQAFVRCLDVVQECKGLTSVAVTKILHRKRPDLVPLNDSRLRAFYGTGPSYPQLFSAIHGDLTSETTQSILEHITRDIETPLGRPLTHLRALDIIIWMYVRENE